LYKAGAVGKAISFMIDYIPHFFPSCQGSKNDLDGDLAKFPRSREFTEELVNKLPVNTLWKDYGIIPDVVVCSLFFFPIPGFCGSNQLSGIAIYE
jgi:hypothetical protein